MHKFSALAAHNWRDREIFLTYLMFFLKKKRSNRTPDNLLKCMIPIQIKIAEIFDEQYPDKSAKFSGL